MSINETTFEIHDVSQFPIVSIAKRSGAPRVDADNGADESRKQAAHQGDDLNLEIRWR